MLCETRAPPRVASPPTPRASESFQNRAPRGLRAQGHARAWQKPQALRHFKKAPTSLSSSHSSLHSWGTPSCLHQAAFSQMPKWVLCLARPTCCVWRVGSMIFTWRFLDPAEASAKEEVNDRLIYQHTKSAGSVCSRRQHLKDI